MILLDNQFFHSFHNNLTDKNKDEVANKLYQFAQYLVKYDKSIIINKSEIEDIIQDFIMRYELIIKNYKPYFPNIPGNIYRYLKRCFINTLYTYNNHQNTGLNRIIREMNKTS